MSDRKRCVNCRFWEFNELSFPKTNCALKSKIEMDKLKQPSIDFEKIKQGYSVLVHHQVGVSTGENYVCDKHEYL